MSTRRSQIMTAARFDANRGPIADYVLTARRPATPREDTEHEQFKNSGAWLGGIPRQVTLNVPMLAQADQYTPPQFVESVISLGEEGARELIEQLQAALEWLREPYEPEETTK